MCLLIATTGSSRPSKKALRRAAKNNPDGFGFAVIGDGKIHTYRSMDINSTISEYFTAREEYPNSPSIFHLRITTHGATNVDNCHPFRVNDDVVLGHNGMLPIKEEDGKSDTRIFAEDWLPEFDLVELLDTESGFKELENFATGSKLAFLNTSDLLRHSLYIVNEHLGHWNEGVWYSNASYKKSYGYSYYKPSYSTYAGIKFTPSDDFRFDDELWDDERLSGDEVWSEEENKWIPLEHADEDYDFVKWVCRTCGNQQMFDLNTDTADLCEECGTCWYCFDTTGACKCSDNEER